MSTTTVAPAEMAGAMPFAGAFLATLAPRTRANHLYDLRLWVRWLAAEGIDPARVDRATIERWSGAGRQAGQTPRTVATRLAHVCGAYRWAWQTGHEPVDRGAGVIRPRRPRPCPRPWLGRQDLRRLLAVAAAGDDVEMAAAIHLWGLSGTRCGETLALDVTDLGTHDGRPTIRVTRGKSTGTDVLVLPEVSAVQVERARAGRTYGPLLVNHWTGRRLSPCIARKRLAALTAAAGLPGITPQGLRVGFITLSLDAGMPERDVMIAAGHASSAQTALYDRHRRAASHPVGPALAAWIAQDG